MATYETYIKNTLDNIFVYKLKPGQFFGFDHEKFQKTSLDIHDILIKEFSDNDYWQVIEVNSNTAPGTYKMVLQLKYQEEPFNIIINITNYPRYAINVIKSFGKDETNPEVKKFEFIKDLSNSLIGIKEYLLSVLVEAKTKADELIK